MPVARPDSFDFATGGALEFVEHLRRRRAVTYIIEEPLVDWVSEQDLPQLVAMLDSKERCASVGLSVSSYLETRFSTVGVESLFLINGFRAGRYPAGLNSTRNVLDDKKAVKAWWSSRNNTNSQGLRP